MPLRTNKKSIEHGAKKPQRTFRGGFPYGYNILDGKLVTDPREIKIVRKILALHQKGMSFNAISILLSNQKVPSKLGKHWNDKTVASIIRKHPSNKTTGENRCVSGINRNRRNIGRSYSSKWTTFQKPGEAQLQVVQEKEPKVYNKLLREFKKIEVNELSSSESKANTVPK